MKQGPRPRVVVTGCGAVSAWGWGVDSFWAGVCGAETAVGPFDRFDSQEYLTHVAGEVPNPPPTLPGRYRHWNRWSIADRFAVCAAVEAVEQAGLPRDLSRSDAAVLFGSSTGGMFESENFYGNMRHAPPGREAILALAPQPVSAPGDAVARELKASGPVETVSSACSSAALAIGLALEMLRDGRADVALAGGSDVLCRVTYGGFNALRAVDERPTRPFREGRSGLSLGEGSGVLVLERIESAQARGALPLAELVGAGVSADAHHMTAPHPDGAGAAAALAVALDDAGLAPEAVDFVNAHGTGTPLNDLSEFRALRSVLGDRLSRVPVTSTKGSVGHLLGSAGAIEAVATVLCLLHQRVHPTPGAGEIDPATPVRLVRRRPHAGTRLQTAASLNLGFGGSNGALLFSRWGSS